MKTNPGAVERNNKIREWRRCGRSGTLFPPPLFHQLSPSDSLPFSRSVLSPALPCLSFPSMLSLSSDSCCYLSSPPDSTFPLFCLRLLTQLFLCCSFVCLLTQLSLSFVPPGSTVHLFGCLLAPPFLSFAPSLSRVFSFSPPSLGFFHLICPSCLSIIPGLCPSCLAVRSFLSLLCRIFIHSIHLVCFCFPSTRPIPEGFLSVNAVNSAGCAW